jgi:AbiV family abortive infection protein
LADPDLFQAVEEGINHIVRNFGRLDTAARTLSKADDHITAKILGNCAKEEAAKVLILVDVVRCPKSEMGRLLGYFNDHFAKCIYADACAWSTVDLNDLESIVKNARKKHYVDGPTGTEWIFDNDVIDIREQTLYVDYIRDDSDRAGQGPCYWQHPLYFGLGYWTLPVIKVARALHQVGLTSRAGLKVVAETWRPQQIRSEMKRDDELQQLIRQTLKALEDKDLLVANEDEVYRTIVRSWPFPLWSLDLKKREDNKEDLRKVRRSWSADYY